MSARAVVRLAIAATALCLGGCTLGRPADPVVIKGSQLPAFNAVPAGDVVAFRWINGWDQVPVQVDERKSVDLATVFGPTSPYQGGYSTTVYADATTFVGADPDPDLDADDELAFMAKDVGLEAPADATEPPGVTAGSGIDLHVEDPPGQGAPEGWIYLFRREPGGNLTPGAGEHYVDYQFRLLSGDYKTTYGVLAGPNPENSTVSTPFYAQHFSDRWLNDVISVKAGNASEADILERAKAQLIPGDCSATEDGFDQGEGAFIANKVGPVRAIRSYLGAASGPMTQREHVFYEQREDIRTFLRVHAIPGVLDYFDYSAAATGMTYRNNRNTGGVTIDGTPDAPTPGALDWESVDGPQGGLSIVHRVVTDIPNLALTSYYLDDSTPGGGAEHQCTGDAQALGASGPWINQPIPDTDPVAADHRTLRSTRTLYFEEPGKTNGPARARAVGSPFLVTVSSFP